MSSCAQVKAADGSPLPGFEVHWWYVKHLVTTSPPDVQVSTTGGGPVTVSAVPEGDWDDSGDPPPGTTWPVTDRHGAVTFEIKVPDREFGPSFDLRVPGFMRDPHERFHANVLNDTQVGVF